MFNMTHLAYFNRTYDLSGSMDQWISFLLCVIPGCYQTTTWKRTKSCLQGMVSSFIVTDYVHLLNDILSMLITESTSVAISATFGYLAIHQNDQEKAYSEIQKSIPKDREPVYIDFCFIELPSGPRIRCWKICVIHPTSGRALMRLCDCSVCYFVPMIFNVGSYLRFQHLERY